METQTVVDYPAFAVSQLVCVLPHKVDGSNVESIFAGQFGIIEQIDAVTRRLLIQCGPDIYNYDLWIRSHQVRAATSEEVCEWNSPRS